MGYRSNVKILMAKKAYEELKVDCLANTEESVRNMVLKPYYFETDETDGSLPTNSVMIGWNDCKWNGHYQDVRAVETFLICLNDRVEIDGSLLKDNFYKIIEIGEDNATDERTNDVDDEFVHDFYVNCNFSI